MIDVYFYCLKYDPVSYLSIADNFLGISTKRCNYFKFALRSSCGMKIATDTFKWRYLHNNSRKSNKSEK